MPILKQLFAPAVVWGVDGSGVCTSIQTLRILQDGCRRTLLIVERRFKYNRCVANFAPSIIFMKGNTILGNSFFFSKYFSDHVSLYHVLMVRFPPEC